MQLQYFFGLLTAKVVRKLEDIKINCKLLEVKALKSKKGNDFYLATFAKDTGETFKCLVDKFYSLPAFSPVNLTFKVEIDYNQNLTLRLTDLVLASK